MSDPVSIGLAVLAAGLQVAQGFAQQSAADRQARTIEQQGKEEADRRRRDARRLLGLGRANIGASGLLPEGSPIEVLSDSASEAELTALTVERDALRQAAGVRSRAQGAVFRGFVGAGSTLVGPIFGGPTAPTRSLPTLPTVHGARAAHPS